jgi:hypothetical protein
MSGPQVHVALTRRPSNSEPVFARRWLGLARLPDTSRRKTCICDNRKVLVAVDVVAVQAGSAGPSTNSDACCSSPLRMLTAPAPLTLHTLTPYVALTTASQDLTVIDAASSDLQLARVGPAIAAYARQAVRLKPVPTAPAGLRALLKQDTMQYGVAQQSLIIKRHGGSRGNAALSDRELRAAVSVVPDMAYIYQEATRLCPIVIQTATEKLHQHTAHAELIQAQPGSRSGREMRQEARVRGV